jgi:hypothetical protein
VEDCGALLPVARPITTTCGRFPCNNYEIELIGGINSAGEEVRHPAIVSIAYDAKGQVREIVFEGRGKVGQGVDLMFHDLSIKLSRILQERDPETGEILW